MSYHISTDFQQDEQIFQYRYHLTQLWIYLMWASLFHKLLILMILVKSLYQLFLIFSFKFFLLLVSINSRIIFWIFLFNLRNVFPIICLIIIFHKIVSNFIKHFVQIVSFSNYLLLNSKYEVLTRSIFYGWNYALFVVCGILQI